MTAKEIFEDKNISKEDVLHMVSIVFPDVRLKNYIEIRGADSMPICSIMAYCALVKGLLYSENILILQTCSTHKDYLRDKRNDVSYDKFNLRYVSGGMISGFFLYRAT